MDLRHLRYFVAVAEESHFGRAAKRLHVSQPPVSLAIREMETELGLLLFERTSRRTALTPVGQELLRDARAVLARLDAMEEHARRAATGQIGSLALGFISLANYSFLPSTYQRFHEAFPGIKISLSESTSDVILAELEKETLDIGYVFAPVASPTLSYRPLLRERLIVALPECHPLATRDRVPMKSLADENFLIFPRQFSPLVFDTIVGFCAQHGFSPRIAQEARQMQTIVSLVSGGSGVALVPDCLRHLKREGVVYRQMAGSAPNIETGIAWRKLDDSRIVRAFLEHLPRAGKAETGRQGTREDLPGNTPTTTPPLEEM
ncbi:LysR family transcriptional regulator [Pigmentiphaga aceris]|uniref:LysR family transcriptional regulator n=1 Tax=Pigmentiphaga aceris TaxID=1940612 RepID=A0A5C0ARF6_9BURK|nr:LysR family transcriptional regulator [Pigmentiphaga aceris]QEI04702.1 LysR family transcriptional regulator [Pigmentiphaga aceris]